MRGARKSRLAAGAVFCLISVCVIGGMGWAAANSFELAKRTVNDEHTRLVNGAVLKMSMYMAGILNTETARPYTNYQPINRLKPFRAYRYGVEHDVEFVDILSPLATKSPHPEWVDLYFQSDPDGVLTSPQFPSEIAIYRDHAHSFFPPTPHAEDTWEWLKGVLPRVDLAHKVRHVCRCRPSSKFESDLDDTTLLFSRAGDQDPSANTQISYLPEPRCVDAAIAERNVRQVSNLSESEPLSFIGEVEFSIDPITVFWLGEDPTGSLKLAFVRECHSDNQVSYQGFIGDWNRLRPHLQNKIAGTFPDANIEPLIDTASTQGKMGNLPVALVEPTLLGGAEAEAWRRIRGMLIISWIAAAAVLVVAGLGLRNLVALTERRMQFAYAVTHELRTPLTTFRLYSDMLSAGLVPEEKKQQYLDTLNTESQRLSVLVSGVLEYARLENQQVKLNLEETSGEQLLQVICESLERMCKENGAEAITKNTLNNGHTFRTDVDVVNRIAGVLVNNACHHAQGAQRPMVYVGLGGDASHIYLDIIDSGAGIDRADSRSIFKPFRRGRRADENAQGGIGLGLALAKNWAELLGGRLELAARHHPQYGGAHFRLTLPVTPRA